jgi:hypothetical protein
MHDIWKDKTEYVKKATRNEGKRKTEYEAQGEEDEFSNLLKIK